MKKSLLHISGLTKSFDQSGPVVNQVGFEVKEDEIFALLGPSGCGKTTTLRLIAGFEHCEDGEIHIEGELVESPGVHLSPQKRKVGFVFQDYALFPHMNALENVAFGLKEVERKKRPVLAEEVLCRTGMEKYKHRMPDELSGGQQQRVALARAIAPKPKLVLMDEPFSGLDAMLRDSTRKEVRAILKKSGMSAILVTHDQEEALSFADRIAVMNNGQIEQIGTPEEVYYHPNTQFVAQFLGRTNLFRAHADGSDNVETRLGPVKINREAEGFILCSIRPEHLTIERCKPNGKETGIITGREFRGHDITYHVLFKGDKYIVHTDNRLIFDVDEPVVVKPLEPAVVLEQKANA
ncbi:MAG: iron ABC transporter ATP-binding protein [Balneola sp.]|nr:iron ABC transporter ATP-binding protein [Balneola sp.]|tara:strand:+ start:47602 stop:48654 length:1053 start_codon:yes stop_codon:yes gene_type:complete